MKSEEEDQGKEQGGEEEKEAGQARPPISILRVCLRARTIACFCVCACLCARVYLSVCVRADLALHLHLVLRVKVLHLPHGGPVAPAAQCHLLVAGVAREARERLGHRDEVRLLGDQRAAAADLDLLAEVHHVVAEVEHGVLLVALARPLAHLEGVAAARLRVPRGGGGETVLAERLLRVACEAAVRGLIEQHHSISEVEKRVVVAWLQRRWFQGMGEALLGFGACKLTSLLL